MRAAFLTFLVLMFVRSGFAHTPELADDCTNATQLLASYQGQLPEATWQAAVDWLQIKLDEEPDESLRCQWASDMAGHLAEVTTAGPPTGEMPAASTHQDPVLDASPVVYNLPFGSTGNRLELDVIGDGTESMKLSVVQKPSWVLLDTTQPSAEISEAGTRLSLVFDVATDAPVAAPSSLILVMSTAQGTVVQKEIRLQVEAPKDLVLHPNYPNPFNPSTTIGFQLPQPARVDLRIYDILGREVAQLLADERGVGSHSIAWNASQYASGFYMYRLVVETQDGTATIKQGQMLLVK